MHTESKKASRGDRGEHGRDDWMVLGDSAGYTARDPPGEFFPPAFFLAEKSGQLRDFTAMLNTKCCTVELPRRR